jgi:origin recognition complex subunit 5
VAAVSELRRARERGIDLELPHITKLLLLAAYAASHNPPETDTRFFSRHGSGRRRPPTRSKDAERAAAAQQLAGPRAFTLDRLLAIFYALQAGADAPAGSSGGGTAAAVAGAPNTPGAVTATVTVAGGAGGVPEEELFAQLSALVNLNLLTRLSPAHEMDVIRYRAAVSEATASSVATTLRVDLGKYLYDPVAAP